MTFTAYLLQKRLSPDTINSYTIYLKYYTDWLEKEDLNAETITYNDVIAFMQHLTRLGKTKGVVNALLCIIRHHCNWQIATRKRPDNPAAGVFIKGMIRKLPNNLLSFEELEELYRQYLLQINIDRSKKIMLGLLIYQGLIVDEIIRLEAIHLRMKEGKIFIKGTKRTNERLLNLHAGQVLLLQQYMSDNKYKDGPLLQLRKKGMMSERNICNQVKYMFRQLRQLNPKLINAQQIRNSIITHWLRQHHLRQVQYMAGHKYVSSTQRYEVNNLDDLQNELVQHHPFS